MFAFVSSPAEVRKSVRYLDGADKRSVLHMLTIGMAHLDVETGTYSLSVSNFLAEYGANGAGSTSPAAIARYRNAAPLAVALSDDEAEVRELMHAFNLIQTPWTRNGVKGKGLKKDEVAEFANNVRIYMGEGASAKDAVEQARLDLEGYLRENQADSSQSGKGARPNDGTSRGGSDEDGAGDPGEMSAQEALTAAIRLLKIAEKGLTPGEAAVHASLIAEAFDVVGGLFEAAEKAR